MKLQSSRIRPSVVYVPFRPPGGSPAKQRHEHRLGGASADLRLPPCQAIGSRGGKDITTSAIALQLKVRGGCSFEIIDPIRILFEKPLGLIHETRRSACYIQL
jgi:hypothetical protein